MESLWDVGWAHWVRVKRRGERLDSEENVRQHFLPQGWEREGGNGSSVGLRHKYKRGEV